MGFFEMLCIIYNEVIISPDSVINDASYRYLSGSKLLLAFLITSGCQTYDEFYKKYEGATIKEYFWMIITEKWGEK